MRSSEDGDPVDSSCPNAKLDDDEALLDDDAFMGMPPIELLEKGDELELDGIPNPGDDTELDAEGALARSNPESGSLAPLALESDPRPPIGPPT
jgi:hypothetical protein